MTLKMSSMAAALLALCALAGSPAQAQSTLVQSWRTDGGWLTELRRHADGSQSCSMGKEFTNPHQWVLSVVRGGEDTLLLVVDQQQAPSGGGNLVLSANGAQVATLQVSVQGPAFATTGGESADTLQAVEQLAEGPATLTISGRTYMADLTGLGAARDQLNSCLQQIGQ